MPQAEPPAGSRRFGRLLTALAAGVAGGLIAPLLYPSVARNARPVAKRVLKTAIGAFEQGRVAAAELGEQASDLFAEARAEYDGEKAAVAPPGGAGPEIVPLRGSGREAAGS
jgi:hypothetical protein